MPETPQPLSMEAQAAANGLQAEFDATLNAARNGKIGDMVVKVAFTYGIPPHSWDDIEQVVFEKLLRNPQPIHPETGRIIGLWTVTRNTIVSHIRHQAARPETPASSPTIQNPGVTWLDLLLENETSDTSFETQTVDRSVIVDGLQSIPAKQREVLILHYWGGLTQVEIAAKMGIPLSTVKGAIHHGYAKLRKILSKDDV